MSECQNVMIDATLSHCHCVKKNVQIWAVVPGEIQRGNIENSREWKLGEIVKKGPQDSGRIKFIIRENFDSNGQIARNCRDCQ